MIFRGGHSPPKTRDDGYLKNVIPFDKFRTFPVLAAYTSIMILEGFFALLSNIMILSAGIDTGNSFPQPLSKEREKEFLLKAAAGDREARDALVKHNLRLVAYIAKKYVNYPDKDELLSVGTYGLIKAIDSYKPGKSTTLATYASRCIENEILMAMRGYKKRRSDVSIYDRVGADKEGNDVAIVDMLAVDEDTVYTNMEAELKRGTLKRLMERTLKPREKQLICYRYGLNDDVPLTQQETAERLGISRSYVSRMEKAALIKLRREIESENIEL